MNANFFGNRVFTEVVKVRSFIRGLQTNMTDVFKRRGEEIQRRSCEDTDI